MTRVFLVAGEASGDRIGARLAAALKQEAEVELSGVGGPHMAAEGIEMLFPIDDLAVMGLFEVVPRIPRILSRLRQTERAVRAFLPDVVVTIDAPGFNFRLGKRLGGEGIPLVHYVAPTVWAWKPGRARRIARFLDRILTLFPFEPPYFEREGLPATFVGHPVIEEERVFTSKAFRDRHGIADSVPLLVALPGSRKGEVSRMAPIFAETIHRLVGRIPQLQAVVVVAPSFRDEIGKLFVNLPVKVVERDEEGLEAYAAADLALAASGTVTLELALAGTPMVVAYRMAEATWQVVRRMVKVDTVSIVNLVLGRKVIPEYLQGKANPSHLVDALEDLLRDPAARAQQVEASAEALALLGEGGESPSRKAARAVLAMTGGE